MYIHKVCFSCVVQLTHYIQKMFFGSHLSFSLFSLTGNSTLILTLYKYMYPIKCDFEQLDNHYVKQHLTACYWVTKQSNVCIVIVKGVCLDVSRQKTPPAQMREVWVKSNSQLKLHRANPSYNKPAYKYVQLTSNSPFSVTLSSFWCYCIYQIVVSILFISHQAQWIVHLCLCGWKQSCNVSTVIGACS